MFVVDQIELPQLGLRGLEADMSEEERAIQDSAHRFAEEVMRPIAEKLDKMTPEEVVAEGSPLWDYLRQIRESGLLDLEMIGAMSDEDKSRFIPIIFEELAWGDSGLTLLAMVTSFPAFAAYATGDPELIERFGDKIGCWLGTQPERGSDVVDFDATEIHPGTRQNRGGLHARIEGDEVIVNGQSSAWVSAGPVAECTLAYFGCDYGDGLFKEDGSQNLIAMLIPFDLDGVSKGKPLDKLGQRSLPQGEIFFDEVRVPLKYVLAQKDAATASFFGALTFANMEMAVTFTGVARAAYEHALDYVHERKQGGVPIIEHQSVRLRLFGLWQKLEACRALAHRVFNYNYSSNGPHVIASMTSKTFVTQNAFEIASEALQLFGGNGLTREYPIEKLLRDARASLIEDGENNVLGLKTASMLSAVYKDKHDL
jgi:alkylation response protein AidB-like acyl-CoA dehydrogenase